MKLVLKLISVSLILAVLLQYSAAIEIYAQDENIQDVYSYYLTKYDAKDYDDLVNNKLMFGAGTFATDWIVYLVALEFLEDISSQDYSLKLQERIVDDHNNNELNTNMPMDYYRIALVLESLGVDTKSIKTSSGEFDFIGLGIIDNEKVFSLINSMSWALLVLDSIKYEIPENSAFTRDELIKNILMSQLSDKGFALTGLVSDPDVTAMVITALAPYYNDTKEYNYILKETGQEVNKSCAQVIDESFEYLSNFQLETADFRSWGNRNSQTGAQVILALTSLGINPLEDERFIKNGKNLIDGLMQYKMEDGSFANIYPPERSDNKATEQALMALLSIERLISENSGIYDLPSNSEELTESNEDDLQKGISASFVAVIVVIIAILVVQFTKKRINSKGEYFRK